MTIVAWTDEKIELLKKLWARGVSKSQIAADLGGISRNSVSGKLNRLGLLNTRLPRPKRESPLPRIASARPPRSNFNPGPPLGRQPDNMLVKPRNPPALTSDQKEYVMGKGIPLLDLARDQCHWPVNDRKGFDDHLFCGAKGYPYCPHHALMAYQPPRGPVYVGRAA